MSFEQELAHSAEGVQILTSYWNWASWGSVGRELASTPYKLDLEI